jgi:threonyl-tRNA synthetase
MSQILDEKLQKMTKGEQELWALRHTAEHVLHTAMQNLYPKLKKAMGPATPEGFYFDFDLDVKISEEEFSKIEREMQRIIDLDLPIVQEYISVNEAKKVFKGNPYKLEWVDEIEKRKEKVSIYKIGDIDLDLCSGPHVESTGKIKAFKLLSVAGAYWHGDEKNKMLARIYGTVFPTKEGLEEYLNRIEEAKKRDHRKLGKELDLFSFHDEGPGFPFWHPKGMILRDTLMEVHSKLHKDAGYQLISTPILLSEELWHQSGHWDNYKDKMYFTKIDGRTFAIKPMNCPGGILIYKDRPRSYRDLPLRYAENGEVHRHEPSGTLHGLFRVRAFRQDDAHIFAQESQVEEEIKNTVKLILKFYNIFHFDDVEIELSTRPVKSIGSDETWKKSEATLQKVLEELKLKFRINKGDGAFYGPKIDFHIKDSLGRLWQCGTIQLDFSMPERFSLEYIDNEGQKKQPVMIHRTVIGSIQRFVGILIEHYAGAFPTWLAPVQVKVLPITERHLEYANKVAEELKREDIRVEVDDRNERLQAKIRDAQMEKVAYMFIVGDKEMEAKTVAVRKRNGEDLGSKNLEDFIKALKKEIEEKSID